MSHPASVRESVLQAVRTLPYSAVAKQYGVSKGTISKWVNDAGLVRHDFVPGKTTVVREELERGAAALVGGVPPTWREWTDFMTEGQELRRRTGWGEREAVVSLPSSKPLLLLPFGDQHVASWGTDHRLFTAFTDFVLAHPRIRVALTGDFINLAVKLRGVLEVKGDIVPPDIQHEIVQSWLSEMAPQIAFACRGNHDAEREDLQVGDSIHRRMIKKYVPFFDGIGHASVFVGEQRYRIAVAHRFPGSSSINPLSGHTRYLERQWPEADVLIAGDVHHPEMGVKWRHGRAHVLINGGTLQTRSDFGQKFSISALAEYPCVELHPDRHLAIPFQSIGHWLAATRQEAA